MKKFISCIMCLCLIISCTALTAFADETDIASTLEVSSEASEETGGTEEETVTVSFPKNREYKDFKDVGKADWFYGDIVYCYERSILGGVSQALFQPDLLLTNGQAVVIAARLHKLYYENSAVFESSGEWYTPYAQYAEEKGLVPVGWSYYTNMDKFITRKAFVSLLAGVLPEDEFESINNVEYGTIPDLPSYETSYEAVYMMYRAGIVTGRDALGSFEPDKRMRRSETAAVISRVADKTLRKSFDLSFKGIPQKELEEIKYWIQSGENLLKSEDDGMVYALKTSLELCKAYSKADHSDKAEIYEDYILSLKEASSCAGRIKSHFLSAKVTAQYFPSEFKEDDLRLELMDKMIEETQKLKDDCEGVISGGQVSSGRIEQILDNTYSLAEVSSQLYDLFAFETRSY